MLHFLNQNSNHLVVV